MKQSTNEKRGASILYGIDDIPPWYLSIPMAFQHYLTMIGAIVSIPFILTPALCMSDEDPARGLIISTMIFVTGIVTYIQATWGCRLPIVQGGTISFLVSDQCKKKKLTQNEPIFLNVLFYAFRCQC